MDYLALSVSLRLASWTTGLLLVLGVPLSWWLVTTKSRLRPWVEALVTLPVVLPPTVLGFYLLLLEAPGGPLGRLMAGVTGGRVPFTFGGVLLGSVLVNLPFAVRPFVTALASVDRALLEAAACLGASPGRTFFRVVLPLAWPGIVGGAVLTFAHSLGEFGVVLMLGGNVAGSTRTVSIVVYDHVQALDYQAAHRTALTLVAVAVCALIVASIASPARK